MSKEAKKLVTNPSGIIPSGNRVIVRPDEIDKVTKGGIIIPETEAEKHAGAQSIGTLIATGPDAFRHVLERVYRLMDGEFKLVEKRDRGYSTPFAEVGDRIAFAKYGGLAVEGADHKMYRILNDEDITARVSEGVNFTDIKSREPVSNI